MASRTALTESSRSPQPGRRGGGFALLSNAFLDELRARTSLSALIGRSIKLQKAGREWKAPCPFHNEKTPSFYVNDDKNFYHCFGCSAHGDAIRWMTDQRGLPFIDAVKELADAAGLEMPTPDPATRERTERAASLQDVTGSAAEWFAARLKATDGGAARDYLLGRALTEETIAEFGLGFAPPGRRNLADALSRFPDEMLVDSGMLIRADGDGQPYDRFRNRVMIPIADARGRVIAFGGRILGQGEPKYLNSPETPLFDKGATLWNLHRAGPASRRAGRLIVVEGYLDAIALHQAGIREAVAPLGTALTERQLERAWSLVDVPIVCLDGDTAGQKAALRAADRALPILRPGKSLAFATLPAGMDPDDLIRFGGAAEFEKAISHTTSMVELLYSRERAAGDMTQPEQRAGLRSRLEALAASCTDPIMAQEYRRSFSDLFFEEFGFKRAERRAVASAALHTLPGRSKLSLRDNFVRSALFGLSNFPATLRSFAETVSELHADNEKLCRWRDTLTRAAYRGSPLDEGCIASILEADGLADVLNFDLCADLRFPFMRADADEQLKLDALEGLVTLLNEERELDGALLALDRDAKADAGGDRYLAIEAERQYLRDQRTSLRDRAYGLGSGGQD